MNIVIAPDSFKGSLTAKEAASAMAAGVLKARPDSSITLVPMADGGEGTMECLVEQTGGTVFTLEVKGPLGDPVLAKYGVLGDGATCVVELAEASGLYLIAESERNPLRTTTYGFGQLIRAGLDAGCRRFILGLGGSATNDGGAGMLQALGAKLLDAEGNELPFGGGSLSRLDRIDLSAFDARIASSAITVACDVDNPFVGPSGASHVFGPQKGATPDMVETLDRGLTRFADVLQAQTGVRLHDMPGAGAAGGTAGPILALMGGRLRPGFEVVAEAANLERHVKEADLVLTGEGQTDFQTARGKTPCGVARLASQYGVPVVVISGSIGRGIEELHPAGIQAVFSMINRPMPLAEAMERAAELLEQAAEQVMRVYAIGR